MRKIGLALLLTLGCVGKSYGTCVINQSGSSQSISYAITWDPSCGLLNVPKTSVEYMDQSHIAIPLITAAKENHCNGKISIEGNTSSLDFTTCHIKSTYQEISNYTFYIVDAGCEIVESDECNSGSYSKNPPPSRLK
ncbi:hypothetical protein Bealeia1_01426 [Candidatus Bealeia paramacronuclearis]|uniref:Uncharacterized protein n=1 Tax=Candidatus Bealeia paramacronuclearis TaxID=1921001 RepID=A0ABZ2C6H9_9PROT|nr:hypothetical protein [Candidatus Bealeia paramacronuclearis]